MQNCIEANEVGGLDVPNIFADRRDLANFTAGGIRAAGIQIAVESSHFVPCIDQHGCQNSTNVTKVSSYKNEHEFSPGRSSHTMSAATPLNNPPTAASRGSNSDRWCMPVDVNGF